MFLIQYFIFLILKLFETSGIKLVKLRIIVSMGVCVYIYIYTHIYIIHIYTAVYIGLKYLLELLFTFQCRFYVGVSYVLQIRELLVKTFMSVMLYYNQLIETHFLKIKDLIALQLIQRTSYSTMLGNSIVRVACGRG